MAHLPPANGSSRQSVTSCFPPEPAAGLATAEFGVAGFYHGNTIIKEKTMSRQSTLPALSISVSDRKSLLSQARSKADSWAGFYIVPDVEECCVNIIGSRLKSEML